MGTTNHEALAAGTPAMTQQEIDLELAGYEKYIASQNRVAVPRVALQALAEWANPHFAFDRISARLPRQHPRYISWNLHDDLHVILEQERMAFLKDTFKRAYSEASKRERDVDPARGYGGNPSLELFMECVGEMEDPHWDEPLPLKEVAERKRKIKAGKAELAKWKKEADHPTPEHSIKSMTWMNDVFLFSAEKNLTSEDPEIRAKAQGETRRLIDRLQELHARPATEEEAV